MYSHAFACDPAHCVLNEGVYYSHLSRMVCDEFKIIIVMRSYNVTSVTYNVAAPYLVRNLSVC